MTDQFSETRGREMAVQMIRELGKAWGDLDLAGVPDDRIRERMIGQEPAVLLRYLATVQRGSAELQRGFYCVLSDYLGCTGDQENLLQRYEREVHRG